MKRSSGIIVTGLSATLLSTGAVLGSGFLSPDTTSTQNVAESQQATAGGSSSSSSATDSSSTTDSSTSSGASGSADTGTTSPDATATDTTPDTSGTATYDGEAVSSRYGTFQAEITVENGQMTAIDWVQAGESDPHSQQINSYAMPVLEDAILQAQDTNVGYVSGASFTSDAVEQAVYSAMQVAGLA
ncbi:FMN-binding protein [Demequina phytophila]|uniref:FMN-binding protein n=1 Tax=Demequina phytophila TaxID=1638981 RepID=UPI000784FC7C|nr:FMN-binding protein [Demequina phytophila]